MTGTPETPKLHSGEGPDTSSKVETQLLTEQGLLLGTVPYRAPEQREGRDIDGRSDIFSFALLLYEMATGTRPFQGALLFRSSRRSSRDLLPHAGDQVCGTGFVAAKICSSGEHTAET